MGGQDTSPSGVGVWVGWGEIQTKAGHTEVKKVRALWKAGVKQHAVSPRLETWDCRMHPVSLVGSAGSSPSFHPSTRKRKRPPASAVRPYFCSDPLGLIVSSRDAELHCPSCSLGIQSRSLPDMSGMSHGILALIPCSVSS